VNGMGVKAPPHDILKVLTWRGHGRRDQRGRFGHTNLEHLKEIEALEGYEELADAISKHPDWVSDKIAASASRIIYIDEESKGKSKDKSFWEPKGEFEIEPNPFFFRLYGERKEWNLEERKKLFERILGIYKENGINEESHERVNEELSEYPQDSRFPLVSLKTHHWATWVLHTQLKEKRKEELNEVKATLFKISVYAPGLRERELGFHRLRDWRKFLRLKEQASVALSYLLGDFHPLRLKDCEEVLVLVTEQKREELFRKLLESNLPIFAEAFTFRFVKEENKEYYKVGEVHHDYFGFGISEQFEVAPEKANWVHVLEGFERVAWLSMRTPGLYETTKAFVKEFEREFAPLQRKREVKWLPYELLISVAEGFSSFLEAFEKRSRSKRLTLRKVLKSFDFSLYLYGLKDEKGAFWLYNTARNVIKELQPRFPLNLSVVVADPKLPFWKVLETIENIKKGSALCIFRGDKMIELPDEVVDLVFKYRNNFERDARKQVHTLARIARKVSKKQLELEIEMRYAERKLSDDGYDALKAIVSRIARICGGNEEKRREITSAVLEAIEPFVRRE